MIELSDNFERFINTFKEYRQDAKKNYNIEILKHISMKMINECVKGKGKIVVFGDKDPDGIFSSMILKIYLERLMSIFRQGDLKKRLISVDIRYSDREKDGFGLSKTTYDELSKEYSLIITTDNGTSSGFHSHSIDDLIVTDHHPLNKGDTLPQVPYIFNPNVHRKDGLEYSTSGGMVAYDIVKFIDSVLRSQNKHYQSYLKDPDNNYSHTLMFEVLKEYTAFTLVSDMAILDAPNRRFVLEAFKTISLKYDKIPLYLLFDKEYSQNKLSFNIIPKINIDRMGELNTINPDTQKTYMESFIRPKTFEEYKKAETFILSVDKRRKELLSRLSETIKPTLINGVQICFVEDTNAKVGLAGLIANKLLQRYNKPSIVAVLSSDKKKLSFSGRGHNVKTILSLILPQAGGHSDACGGSRTVNKNEEAKEVYFDVCKKLEQANIEISPKKTEVTNNIYSPLTLDESIQLSHIYKEVAQGVEVSKAIRVAVLKPELSSFFTYKSGEWGKAGFGAKGDSKIDMLVNAFEFPEEKIKNSEIVIFQLRANGEMSISTLFETKEAYLENVKQLDESLGFNISSLKNKEIKQKNKNILSFDICHRYVSDIRGDNILYYKDFEDFRDMHIEDGIIIVPSYVKERNIERKREDVLEFFVGEDKNTPLSRGDLATAYKEFATRLVTLSKSKPYIFIQEDLLENEIISEQAKTIAQKIISNVARKESNNNEKDNTNSNISAYQHANAS